MQYLANVSILLQMLLMLQLLLNCQQVSWVQITSHADVLPLLSGPWVPTDAHKIDFDRLPRVPSAHVIVNDVHVPGSSRVDIDRERGGVNQHNYLVHFDDRYWAMWSDGPGIEDRAGQRVKFATSLDGLNWSDAEFLTPEPRGIGSDSPLYNQRTLDGFRYIARGFWIRDGQLIALASLDEAAQFFGPSLQLHAWRWNKSNLRWQHAGVVADDAINNFPPKLLTTGEWLMSRRTHDYKSKGVHFMVGGVESLSSWQSFPVLNSSSELKAEEPEWWELPDGRLQALFRDNARSGFLYQSLSADHGRTWSNPIKTNFPDATSKLSGTRLQDGRYVLVSNPRPQRRDPLAISISDDGLTFHKMFYLVGQRWVDYPHVIERDQHLWIAFAGGKQSVELLQIKLSDLDALEMPNSPLTVMAR